MTEDLLLLAWRQYWQLSVLVILVSLVGHLNGRRAPQLQRCLWLAVFIKAVTPPVWGSPLGVFSWSQAQLSAEPATAVAGASGPGYFALFATALLVVWLVGVAVAVVVQWRRLLKLRRIVRLNLAEPDSPLLLWAKDTAAVLGLRRSPRVVICPENLGPAVFGLWRATVLLPKDLVETADESVLRPIIRHELLHARRGDTFFAALQATVAVVWWHNPLVWHAIAASNRVAERCVDRDVIGRLGEACGDYARALLRVLELRTKPAPASGLAGLCSAEITADRLKDVFDETRRRRWMPRVFGYSLRFIALTTVLAVTLPGEPARLFPEECGEQMLCLQADAAATQVGISEGRR